MEAALYGQCKAATTLVYYSYENVGRGDESLQVVRGASLEYKFTQALTNTSAAEAQRESSRVGERHSKGTM